MRWIGAVIAVAMIFIIFVDAFEAVVLPRRIKHNYRLARLFYQSAWCLWRAVARLLPLGRWRSGFLSIFGPLSLFGLLAVWAIGLVLGFALLHWSFQTALALPGQDVTRFGTYFYFSGTTFFTLGYGDIVPTRAGGRALSVAESGIGFGFLAIVIGYVPVLYQTFSRREISISLLDARAGSPPTAGELLRRLGEAHNLAAIGPFLIEWERWSAELLESQLSFPVVSFYRSQHDNQSWVGALTMMLDTSALLIAAIDNAQGHQARLTFAMARHAAVDLCLVFGLPPSPPHADRLPPATFDRLRISLTRAGLEFSDRPAISESLAELRGLYEPFISSLAAYFRFELPPFQPETQPIDNWQTSPWMPCSPTLNNLPGGANANFDDVH
jgi:voltage-gated potassium channel Kch